MNASFHPPLPPISEIWVYLSGSPLLALVLTLSAYLLGLTVYERSQRNPFGQSRVDRGHCGVLGHHGLGHAIRQIL